jgi:hypothetical protein
VVCYKRSVIFEGSRSPRARRRAWWAAGLLALAGAFVVLQLVLPRGGSLPDTSRPGRPQIVYTPPTVPLTPERRRAINAVLDAFVPAAVERRNPVRALPLVTSAFHSGISRKDWVRGKLPVLPYDARGAHFHGWTLDYSLQREVSVDVLLQPAATEKRGAIAFTAVFKRERGNWLVDAFIPAASFAPANAETSRILAQPDFRPSAPGGS